MSRWLGSVGTLAATELAVTASLVAAVTELWALYGISRITGYKWLHRAE